MTEEMRLNTDRRFFERDDIQIEVNITNCNNDIVTYMTCNVGKGGLQIEKRGDINPTIGDIVTLDSTNAEFTTDLAIVVHEDKDHIGLAFVDMCHFDNLI